MIKPQTPRIYSIPFKTKIFDRQKLVVFAHIMNNNRVPKQ